MHSLNVPVLCFVFGLIMAQWAETCRRIFNIGFQYVVFIDILNYHIIAKHNGMARIKLIPSDSQREPLRWFYVVGNKETYSGHQVSSPIFLSDFNKIWNISAEFHRKFPMSHLTEIHLMRAALIVIDVRKLIGTFFATMRTRIEFCDFMISYTGRFIIFSVITNIYNKKTKGPILMELFTATEKLKFFFLTTRDVRCVHHGWHGTHRYDIQVVATHGDACVALGIFSVAPSNRSTCPGVYSAPENEYQKFPLG